MSQSLQELSAAVARQEQRVRSADQQFAQHWQQLSRRARRLWAPSLGAMGTTVLTTVLLWSKRRARSPHEGAADPLPSMIKATMPLFAPLIGVGAARMLMSLASLETAPRAGRGLQVSPSVDLARYAGQWFEIARLPTVFERKCARDVRTVYRPQGPGLQVVNECYGKDGTVHRVRGVARVPDTQVTAKLKVSFAPVWLRWVPGLWADYWIIDLAPDYSSALVATPDRRRLWVLSRSPAMPESSVQTLLTRAAAQGIDVTRVKRTAQTQPS